MAEPPVGENELLPEQLAHIHFYVSHKDCELGPSPSVSPVLIRFRLEIMLAHPFFLSLPLAQNFSAGPLSLTCPLVSVLTQIRRSSATPLSVLLIPSLPCFQNPLPLPPSSASPQPHCLSPALLFLFVRKSSAPLQPHCHSPAVG